MTSCPQNRTSARRSGPGELPLGLVVRASEKRHRVPTLPRPRLVSVLALRDEYERMGRDERKTVQELSVFGWSEVRYPYRRGTDDGLDFRRAFGIERKMTPCASEEAWSAPDYLDKRRRNMRYGWLRRIGYCIYSSHVEATAQIVVARRCKQARMHWRHHNAACVCAIIARLRSAA